MGEEEKGTKVPEVTANGTSAPAKENPIDVMTEKTEENNGIKEMEEDKNDSEKVEIARMDEDPKVTEERESKEKEDGLEEGRTEAMEEEIKPKVDGEMEEKEKEAKEEVEAKVDVSKEKEEVEEKVDVSKEKEEVEEKDGGSKEKEEKLEEEDGERSKQRGKRKNDGRKAEMKKVMEEKKEPEPRTPTFDRPQRERKCVERLVATVDKDAVKEFQIEKGRGIPLKDIPNEQWVIEVIPENVFSTVAFKLSRRKADDTFKLLHTILFGRRGKALQIKSNISRFSGFVWHQNEGKEKSKVKEKFDKCNKEKLLEFCDVLDIPITKVTTKKEDVVTKLLDFLVVPHATTSDLLAEKEKENVSKKRKRVAKSSTSGSTPSKRSAKSRRKAADNSKRRDKRSTSDTEDESEEEKAEEDEEEEEQEHENVEEQNEKGALEKSDAEISEHSESEEKNESVEESEENSGKHKKRSATSLRKKAPYGKAKTRISVSHKSSPSVKRTPKKSSSKHILSDEDSDASPKVSPMKKKTEKVSKEKHLPSRKSTSKENTGKKVGKGKEKAKVKENKLMPSDDELRDAICEILKKVDFDTATFTDILKLLARRFDKDLTTRKSSIKLVIQAELTKLADEGDDEDGEGEA
ncbi:DEK domain-containing chromatin-associated protein 3 isoform X1 [Populus alba]|uniref:DEK domain-containing chromatin-associated protein 3 isoform X1 n=1 Tax=Populus alba TaxID=43335 RepID=UPI003CC7791C